MTGVQTCALPILGPQRIEFNAHRVFSLKYLLELLRCDYVIDDFSYVDDNGDLHKKIDLQTKGIESNFGCNLAAGYSK